MVRPVKITRQINTTQILQLPVPEEVVPGLAVLGAAVYVLHITMILQRCVANQVVVGLITPVSVPVLVFTMVVVP
ncbi:hypothetical protein HYS93_02470 [Candidatus Daviesbacteria bacterium]|nr:hypothetical protein [Candidatus Daviesbacteria bacterium]